MRPILTHDRVPSTKSRRAVLLTPDWPPLTGGITRVVQALVDGSSETVDWRVITPAEGAPEVGVRRVRGWLGILPQAYASGGWLADAVGSRIVCGHPFLAPVGVALRLRAHVPVTVIAHGKELLAPGRAPRSAVRSMRWADRVVAVSRATAEVVRARGVPADRVRVAGPTLPSVLAMPARRRGFDEALGLMSISRLHEDYKNLELTIQVTAELARVGIPVRYDIVGDGPLRDRYARMVEELHLREHVVFHGRTDDDTLRRLLVRAHVGLFPSRESSTGFEGFGLVIQEMAAAGLAVVAGDVAGARDAIDTRWSIGLDPLDLDAWVATLTDLARNEERRFKLASAGSEWGSGPEVGAAFEMFMEAVLGEDLLR